MDNDQKESMKALVLVLFLINGLAATALFWMWAFSVVLK